jgi:hypothetical protein
MFCVACQTPYSWTTGEIVTHGRIHNPEFFRWMRDHAEDGQQIPANAGYLDPPPCGEGGITMRNLIDRLAVLKTDVRVKTEIYSVYRDIEHIRDVVMRALPVPSTVLDNRDLRMKYLDGSIDRDGLKKRLAQREKAHAKGIAIRQCYETLMAVDDDIKRDFIFTETPFTPTDYLDRLREICAFVNESLKKVSDTFDCKVLMVPVVQSIDILD